ncbi:MAG: hypothetical protein L6R39_003672 [Caloplaca ligustica]|nr:MAG: hypothetical protein L6R39_003672 [Caloplaca ligustica]
MLSMKLLVAAVLAGFVAAQTSTTSSSSASVSSTNSSSSSDNTVFDVNQVALSERVAWCNDQRTNCPKLCGGKSFTKDNTCLAEPIKVSCICVNGTAPALAAYEDTFASDQCQARFAACRQQNPGSETCIQCGTLKADDVPTSTSSMAAASTAASTSSGAGSTTSPIAAGSSGNPSNGGNVLMGAEMGIKGVVGLLAAIGLML